MGRLRVLIVFVVLALIAAGCGQTDEAGEDGRAGDSTTLVGDGTGEADGTGSAPSDLEFSDGSETEPAPGLPPRTFSLGFAPFPHDLSSSAVDEAYERIATSGDLYAFHTTEGVPWTEALAATGVDGWGEDIREHWARHATEADQNPGHEVYLGLTPLDDSRSRLADYWGASNHMPVPAPFDTLAFDSPEVVTAYINFVREAVDHYDPDYLAIGIEVNLLAINEPDQWPALVSLLDQTYAAIKADHPDLPVFATMTAVDLLPGWTEADAATQTQALDDVHGFSDYFAVSFYPFMSAYLTNPLPADVFDQLAALASGKPLAIAETGYPAQTTSLPSFGLTFDGTPERQQEWIQQVVDAGDAHNMAFIVNFISRDYDALWEKIGSTDVFAIWRDTGLVDENGNPRPALTTWTETLQRPRQ